MQTFPQIREDSREFHCGTDGASSRAAAGAAPRGPSGVSIGRAPRWPRDLPQEILISSYLSGGVLRILAYFPYEIFTFLWKWESALSCDLLSFFISLEGTLIGGGVPAGHC